MANKDLQRAKAAKNDEFYTQIGDIQEELNHYIGKHGGKNHFKDKVVFCNCDDPTYSHFWYYFVSNFTELGLKKLIATHYDENGKGHKLELTREMVQKNDKYTIPKPKGNDEYYEFMETPPRKPLSENGDFRSDECIKILKEADIVVTNPPFSLFREYLAQLMEYKKDFLIIAPLGSVTYKEVFPLIKNNQIWLGYGFRNGNAYFKNLGKNPSEFAKGVYNPETGLLKFRNVIWLTNLDHKKRHEKLILTENYDKTLHLKYDNYDAINVDKTKDIPKDYDGVMGVPVSFLDKYNPEQFEIIGIGTGESGKELGVKKNYRGRTDITYTKNGVTKCPYSRILIKNKLLQKDKK